MSLLFVITGCGNSRDDINVVNLGGANTVVPPPIPEAQLTSVEIVPDRAAIVRGGTLQYTATANFDDGSTVDVTSLVQYQSSAPNVATISADGLATGVGVGQTVISIAVENFTDQATLTVSEAALVFAIDSTGTNLLSFTTSNPSTPSSLAIQGLAAGETLVGLDFRPQNGYLYGLGFNPATGGVQLYNISTQTAPAPNNTTVFATPVGAAVADTFAAGTTFGFDFNPTVDRIRIVASNGQNRRMNPNTGAYVQPDGNLNGGTTSADGAAYTNDNANATITTLYTLDSVTNSLFIQNPPNDGTQASGLTVRDNGNVLDFTGDNGFDIPVGVDVATNNAAVTSGQALAALSVAGVTSLYSIDLPTGDANNLGTIGNGNGSVRGIAIRSTRAGAQAISLSATSDRLVRFNTETPGTSVESADPVTVAAGEVIVGIDFRPATGQLIAFGVNHIANTGTLYRVDPQTAGAGAAIAANAVAFVDAGGAAVDFPDPAVAGYGFDFNPTVDRIRVTTSTGLDFRLNPVTGGSVDGDFGGAAGSVAGVNPDGPIAGAAAGASGAAYVNSFATAPTQGVTTLYTIDATARTLSIQNPPNSGTQVLVAALTLGGAPLNFTAVNGFDIENTVTVTTANAAAAGRALAVLSVGGVNGLYSVSLSNGTATLLGAINATRGLAVGLRSESLI